MTCRWSAISTATVVDDLAVWRGSTGTWFWLTSSSGYDYAAQGQKQWGNQGLGDVPLVGDMDGDGVADLVLWRASTGTWYWLSSTSGFSYASARGVQFGNKNNGDMPMPWTSTATGRPISSSSVPATAHGSG